MARTAPASTRVPGSTCSSVTTPAAGACTGCSCFIASGDPLAGSHRHPADRAGYRSHQRTLQVIGHRQREPGHLGQRHRPLGRVDIGHIGDRVHGEGEQDAARVQDHLVRRHRHQRHRRMVLGAGPAPVGDGQVIGGQVDRADRPRGQRPEAVQLVAHLDRAGRTLVHGALRLRGHVAPGRRHAGPGGRGGPPRRHSGQRRGEAGQPYSVH